MRTTSRRSHHQPAAAAEISKDCRDPLLDPPLDFLLYLYPHSLEIYKMISRKVRVIENGPICRKEDLYGYYDNRTRRLSVCTDRILANGEPEIYANETLLHEAVHVAQSCKVGLNGIRAFGLSKPSTYLSDRREADLIRATKFSGPNSYSIEREAFWMEDKPGQVKYVLQKYCF